MNGSAKITAVVGTYRTGGAIDQAVDAILAAAREAGADVVKIDLREKHIEFCANCRACTQQPGDSRGRCPIDDDMPAILDRLEQSDAVILASPMNMWSVTAILKRFMERLVCYAWWPWGAAAPKARKLPGVKRGAVVATSAAPAIIARVLTPMVGNLKKLLRMLGAKKIEVLALGMQSMREKPDIGPKARAKAQAIGRTLAKHRAL